MKKLILISLLTAVFGIAHADDFRVLLDLRGKWKFALGDDPARASANFEDGKWDEIYAPSPWEDQGYPGYDGYAWYRKHFHASPDWDGRMLYLSLGYVDDVDEVYVNGQFIGFEGIFPPHYQTAYNISRYYVLPPSVLNLDGDNVIAVRVYDGELSGGITHGSLGVFERRDPLVPDFPIISPWKFSLGDDMAWKDPGFDDGTWRSIFVPRYWEVQGYRDYDGYAWYRTRFRAPAELADQTLVLLVGRVDDLDETYLNGERVGRTGTMRNQGKGVLNSDDYAKLRAYTVPAGKLHTDRDNVLAVRVYDGYMHGGIYDWPIGLVTREHYLKWKDRQQKGWNWIQDLLDHVLR